MSAKKNKKVQQANTNKTPVPNSDKRSALVSPTINPIQVANKEQAINSIELLPIKKEILLWIFSIFSSILVFFIIGNIIHSSYHPDINALIANANKIGAGGDARPEPVESLLFHLGILVIPLCLLIFYIIFSKINLSDKFTKNSTFIVISSIAILVLISIIYFDFTAQNPFGQGSGEQPQNSRDLVGFSNFDFFFDGNFLGNYILIYLFIIVPLITCLFFFGLKKYKWESNKLFNTGTTITVYVLASIMVIAIIAINTFKFPYTFENKYDFNAVYYSMTQVYAGVPLLVNGFSNTYGLYPHFLNPIFQFIGLNAYNFSLTLSIILGISFFFNFYFLKRFVNNKIILLLGFFSVIFFPYLNIRLLIAYDCSFAFFPIRYIVPSTLIFLTSLYLIRRSQLLYWVTFLSMGFLMLWNPEFGLVSYLSWIAFNIYTDFYDKNGKFNIKKIIFHTVVSAIVLFVSFIIYKVAIHSEYGSFPDFALLFGTIQKYGSLGLGCLPMVLVHPWNIVVLIYISGFTYSIVKFLKKGITAKSSVIFLVSIIGVGFFAYFQGRSHNWSFSTSCGFCMILLTLLGDELWTTVKTKNVLPLNALFVVFLSLISFSFIEIIFNFNKIKDLVDQEEEKAAQIQEQEQIGVNEQFILKKSNENEKIYILSATPYQGLYFDGHKRVSAFNPGIIDLFQYSDIARMEKTIEDSSFNIFIEPTLFKLPYLLRPIAAIAATYEYTDSTKTMVMLNKRKVRIPSGNYFYRKEAILHRKYSDDTTGLNARVNDANGIGQLPLTSEFSVEILFSPKPQIYPYATLIGNMNDSSGFMIANIKNSSNYFFGNNGKGMVLSMLNKDWVYCVMNVFHDRIEVYENGELAGTIPLVVPIKQSPEKLYIGNLGFLRNYVGAISEIAINNSPLGKEQHLTTWVNIKNDFFK